jgi:hypothetical protein
VTALNEHPWWRKFCKNQSTGDYADNLVTDDYCWVDRPQDCNGNATCVWRGSGFHGNNGTCQPATLKARGASCTNNGECLSSSCQSTTFGNGGGTCQ